MLGATTVGGDGSVPRSAEASAALAARGSALTALFYPDAWIAEHPAEASSVMPSAASAEAMGHHLAAVALHDGPAPYSIGVPTLVVHGSEDQLAVPENAHLLADGIEGAELLLLPGARHAYWRRIPKCTRRFQHSSHSTTEMPTTASCMRGHLN